MSKWALFSLVFLFFTASFGSAEWGEPVNLGSNVNSGGFEYYPCISVDQKTLYFTDPDRPGGFGDDDIWISSYDGVEWGVPVNAGPNVNWEWRDLSPSISSDGTRLYYVSWGRPGGYGSYDIWVSTWEDTMWGPAENLGPNVNSAGDEFTANISFDNKKIYFSSNRPGTFGDDDLWVSEWDSISSQWGEATNLGPDVNTFNAEYCPSISKDGTKLYFARWGGLGIVDIYVSEWQDTMWGPAVNLGSPINTNTWEDGPSISSDGTKLYFASGRESGHPAIQDIWVSEWIPEAIEDENRKSKIEDRKLLQNEPNPFHGRTVMVYSLPVAGAVTLKVYDITGRLIRTLVDERQDPGSYRVEWKAKGASSGIYFYGLRAGDLTATKKMVLLNK